MHAVRHARCKLSRVELGLPAALEIADGDDGGSAVSYEDGESAEGSVVSYDPDLEGDHGC